MKKYDDLLKHYLEQIASVCTTDTLESIRVSILGKSGVLTQEMKELGTLPPEERRQRGEQLNALKTTLSLALEEKSTALRKKELFARLAHEWADVTLPERTSPKGSLHPVMNAMEEIADIFSSLGFQIAEGPEIEDDDHNFTALNISEHHPARQMMDTFYLPGQRDGRPLVLRTHTTNLTVRTLRSLKWNQDPHGCPHLPLKVIAPGRVYRSDYDQTHTPNFHQVDGVVVGRNIHMGHLKGCLTDFVHRYFDNTDLPVRFRPSFFPFTEPSAEIDIGCSRENGTLKIGAGADWLEILGCGMIHPTVLQNCGIDPTQYQGFAFGMGVERVAMLKYGIADLRAFYETDLRWLRHYGFSPLEAAPQMLQATHQFSSIDLPTTNIRESK